MKWHLTSRSINTVVEAPTARDAWDTLRDLPVDSFGLIVTAKPEGSREDEAVPIRTSTLMFAWHRDFEARAFIRLALDRDLGDTTAADLALAGRHT